MSGADSLGADSINSISSPSGPRAVAALRPGTRTAVVVQRAGQRAEVSVTVAERPAPAPR